MGEQALTSYMTSKKHQNAFSASQSASIKTFYQPKNVHHAQLLQSLMQPLLSLLTNAENISLITAPQYPSPTVFANTSSNVINCECPRPKVLKEMLQKDSVTKAEIMWCLYLVKFHCSQRSGGEAVPLFVLMFPDSIIASKMQLQRTKIGYTVNFGLAPYFFHDLKDICASCEFIVVGFDESHNKIAEKGQMDVFVRFWNSKENKVCTRYYRSSFLCHSTSSDLLRSFYEATEGIDLKKLLQVSMDGPNVNKKFFKDLKSELGEDGDARELVNLGTCGLHCMHNAYKKSMQIEDWKIMEFLRALYYLFSHSPARRVDYTKYSGSSLFPLKFCAVRWIENFSVAGRAFAIIDHVKKYVQNVKVDKREPTCSSYKIICSALEDELFPVKFAFFQTIASDVEPFLTQFQSDEPLSPLLYETIRSTLRIVMSRFIRDDILNTAKNICNIYLNKPKNLKNIKDICLGSNVRNALRRIKPNSLDLVKFRKQCRDALIKFCHALNINSPLLYPFTKGISCFDPAIALNSKIRVIRLTRALDYLVEKKWLSSQKADRIQNPPLFEDKMKNFINKKHCDKERLDDFWLNVIPINDKFEELRCLLKMVLILSHGNAFVEKGFSINKEILIENQSNEYLIAQRQVYDAINYYGGIQKIDYNKTLIHAARNAPSVYKDFLKKKNEEATAAAKKKGRKA